MEGETIKIMNQDLVRLDRFNGSNFTRWQDKVRFLLTTLKIFYILDPTLAPLPEPKENDTPQVVATRKKMEEDELICRGHILNALSDRLYDLYTNTYSAREIWEALENKYKAEEEGTKKFLISQYIDFKFFYEKPLLPQIHELQRPSKLVLLWLNYHQVGKVTGRGFSTRVKITPWKRFKNIFALRKNRDQETKMVEESNGGTNKANAVSKANHPKGKNNNDKRNSGNYMSPKKNQEQFKGKKGPCFVCGKPEHYARECRYRKDLKGAVVNAIDEEIIATLSDVCILSDEMKGIIETKRFLSSTFKMKDLGEVDTILGIKVKRNSGGYALNQTHYIEKVVSKFSHLKIKDANTPFDSSIKLEKNDGRSVAQLEYASAIGSLMYAAQCT
uniref:CCHC-type domain-containing protein n=1 Tax=Vitis vinifera TaxID=29760 RepID=A5BPP9_VITVI|nr:hypothetical protein VITISV_008235 [Vitis vinifera]